MNRILQFSYLLIMALLVSAEESRRPSTDCMMSGLLVVAPGTVAAVVDAVVVVSDVMCGSSGR